MDYQSSSYGFNGFTNGTNGIIGDRPAYMNGTTERSAYTNNDRPSYSNHQSSHQEKLEAFRKADSERDSFVQVTLLLHSIGTTVLTHSPVDYSGLRRTPSSIPTEV